MKVYSMQTAGTIQQGTTVKRGPSHGPCTAGFMMMKLPLPKRSSVCSVLPSFLFCAAVLCAPASVEARPFGGSSVSIAVGSGIGPCRTGIRSGYGYGYQPYCGPVYRTCTPYSTWQPYCWPNYSGSVSTFYYGAYPVAPATVISTAPPPPGPHYQTYPPYSSVPGRVYDGFSVPSARPVQSQSRTQASPSSQSAKVHEQTVQIQAALRKLGYYTGSVDGLMGPATQTAIRTFQIDHGLSVTGKVDDKLQKALEKEAFGEEQR